jgi:late competence protein required for DNA uptake (superfamily II DNA/RNA helicase)
LVRDRGTGLSAVIKQWIELPRGCGKTTLLQEIIEAKIAEGKRCSLISPYVQRTYTPHRLLIQIKTVQLARGYSRRCLYFVDEWDAFSARDKEWMWVNLDIEVATRNLNRQSKAMEDTPETWFGQVRLVTAKLWLAEAREKLR